MFRRNAMMLLVMSVGALVASRVGPAWPQDVGNGAMKPIVVFAAASATNAIRDIKEQFAKRTGVEVQASYGSSSTLAQQIANGADADVFLAADMRWADDLADKGLVAKRIDLLGNRLVIVVPNDSNLKVQQPADLLGSQIEHIALGDPDSVPAGKYARQALVKLGIWETLKPKVAAAEDVRHALLYVETGAAEVGVVYATDAAISKKVRVAAELPESLTGVIVYPMVLLPHGKSSPAAESFFEYLHCPASLETFRKYGFTILPSAETTRKPGGLGP